MPHRVLQIIPSLDQSGAEKQLTLLAGGLPRDEFEVHVCALTRGGPLQAALAEQGIPVTVIGKRFKFDPSAWFRLRSHIGRLKPDLVQTWMFAANAYGRTAAWSAGVRRVAASERCVDPWKSWHQLAIDRRLARRTQAIVVNSTGVSDFYQAQGLPAEKFVLIPNGIAPFRGPAARRDQLLADLGLPGNARLLGAVGRLWPQKRVKHLLQACDILQNVRQDFHLLVIGDGPLRDRLESYRDDLHLSGNVHFLGHRADVPQLLPALDMLLLASEFEGLPNVLMEAMAAGIPVVATDIPGNRDLVIHDQTGLLVPPDDRPAFASAILRLLENNDLAQRLGAAGRQRIESEFTVTRMIDRFASLYRKLLA
ncbi:MAG: glycosyltransferase family 4 protein [Pirellulales bacterium]